MRKRIERAPHNKSTLTLTHTYTFKLSKSTTTTTLKCRHTN